MKKKTKKHSASDKLSYAELPQLNMRVHPRVIKSLHTLKKSKKIHKLLKDRVSYAKIIWLGLQYLNSYIH